MKLLYVINHIDWFWSHRLRLAQAAQENGYDVHIAVPGADEKLAEAGFNGYDLPVVPMKTILALRKIVRAETPDIVHAITLKYAFLTGLAVTGLNVKCVYTIAGLGYLFSGESLKPKILRFFLAPFFKFIFRSKKAALIFQNPDDKNLFIRRGFAREDKSFLIPGSGVDLQQFSFTEEPKEEEKLVLMPTRLVHDKGVSVFIEAARILKARGVNAKFQIAGGITQNNPLAISAQEMKEMTADGAAQWLGKVDDMPALYRAAHLIAYPSWYGEGVPKVLLEAASTGRAIVTTDHPGCREAVQDGVTGLLVPVKDAEALANAVETLLNDNNLRRAMSKKSRALAEKKFAADIIVQETLKIYKM